MSLLTKRSYLGENYPDDLSQLLSEIMESVHADYVQILFRTVNNQFAEKSFHEGVTINNNFVKEFRLFLEQKLIGRQLQKPFIVSSTDIFKFPLDDESELSSYAFIPFEHSQKQFIIILGFERSKDANFHIEKHLLDQFAPQIITAFGDNTSEADKDQIYALARSFVNVQEPRQLGFLMINQINPTFNLKSSTIICVREGQVGDEFLIYLPDHSSDSESLSIENYSPQLIDREKDSYLFEFLKKTNEEDLFSTLNLDLYSSQGDMHPYLKAYYDLGVKRAFAFHLVREHKIIGYWFVLSNEGAGPQNYEPALLEPLISQMASTVNNINIYNELADKKKESEILMSLNMDLAATRDKNHLLKLIRSRLQKLFEFSHHFICKINDSDMTMSLLLRDSQSISQYHPLYETVKTAKFPISDGTYDKVLLASEPLVFDLSKLAKKSKLPLHLQINYDSGIKKVVMLALRVDSKLQGIWTIAFTNNQPILSNYLKLIKTASAPISIAVANIRINDFLRKREEERDKLMAMSFELTATRNKRELISTLDQYLPTLLSFQSLSIYVDRFSGEEEPFIYLSKSAELKSRFVHLEDVRRSEVLFEYASIFTTAEITVSELQQLMEMHGDFGFLRSEYEFGARSVVTINLRNDNRRIGILAMFLGEDMHFSDYDHNIFKAVSYQISNAISDLLLNEDLRRRDREKELLLLLSEDIAAVRDKENLTGVIKNRLKPVLGFSHFALGVKVPDHTVISFLSDPDSPAKKHPAYSKVFRQEREDCEDFIEFINESPYPIILNKEKAAKFAQLPDAVHINFQSGIKEIAIVKLFDGVTIFGYCFFFYDQAGIVSEEQFGLIKAIANQFSTAIYNIKANLEIINREKENELLISLSNTTARIRNFTQLMDLVSTKFKHVFSFDKCFIGMLEEDQTSFKVLSPNAESMAIEIGSTSENIIFNIPLDPDLHLHLLDNSSPLILDLKTERRILLNGLSDKYEYPYAVMARFTHRQKLLGIWIMLYREFNQIDTKLFRLLQGVNDQLSNSVANIIANERLSHNEMQKGMLLSFSTNISLARNPTDLISIVDQNMKNILNFDHNIIVLFNDDRDKLYPWILNNEVKTQINASFGKGTGPIPVNDLIGDIEFTSDEPFLVNLETYSESQILPEYLRQNYESGMKYVMFVKLVVRGELIGFWMLWYIDRPECGQQYPEFLHEVANIMATTIANISFNDLIDKREKEKTSLLEFTEAIAGVQNRFQLRKIFSQYLRNLCFINDISLHWFSDDKKSQVCYFWDESAPGANINNFHQLVTQELQLDDPIFGPIIESKDQLSFKINELMKLPEIPPYIKFLCSQNCESITGVPLLRGRIIVGVLFVREFDAHRADQPLFRGLCTQLTIAVSNLIASERVLQQLSQINMYKERLEEEKVYLKQELETSHHYAEVVGESKEIKNVFHMVSQVAPADSTVLILGETGTGKELIARAIHNNSPRKNKLLVKVNCAALPAHLIESELFGHERGSFTGATERRIGKFELANGGSLFLDEIGEMPLELQVKLLRALQEREIERVGGKATIKVDVRIIAATNRNLEQEIASGKFRSDLYFRLSTFPIVLPSLKDRRADIPILASHFVSRFAKKSGKQIESISQRAMQDLLNYNWPGNVRELEHQIERSVIMTDGNTIKVVHLPGIGVITNTNDNHNYPEDPLILKTIDDNERDLIIRTLKHCNGKISGAGGAAELLGVPSTTLNAKIKRLGIKKTFSR